MKSRYIHDLKRFFDANHHLMPRLNHRHHDENPAYWNYLLKPLSDDPNAKSAFEFGCGCGRNLHNMYVANNNLRVIHGCDISIQNATYAEDYAVKQIKNRSVRVKTWECDGLSVQSMDKKFPRRKYDFIMVTIVFEHISVYDIRKDILASIYKTLRSGGTFSTLLSSLDGVGYYDNVYQVNTNCDLNHPEYFVDDLEQIGFTNIQYGKDVAMFENRPWSYVWAQKP